MLSEGERALPSCSLTSPSSYGRRGTIVLSHRALLRSSSIRDPRNDGLNSQVGVEGWQYLRVEGGVVQCGVG